VADAVEMLDHGNPRVLQHGLDQAVSTPGNQQVQHAVQPAHFGNAFPAFVFHQRHHLRREFFLPGRLPQRRGQGPVAMPRFAPAP